MAAAAPGWMNDALADEWIEEEAAPDEQITLAVPKPGSVRVTSGSSAGTFVVREDAPYNKGILNRMPGARGSKVNDFFSPMKLQQLFEPPTPPEQRAVAATTAYGHREQRKSASYLTPRSRTVSRFSGTTARVDDNFDDDDDDDSSDHDFSADFSLSDVPEEVNSQEQEQGIEYDDDDDEQHLSPVVPSVRPPIAVSNATLSPRSDEIIETDIPDLGGFDGRRPSRNFQFTFNVPHDATSTPKAAQSHQPTAATDPRLRLFHFQYDTYTHDHLSNLVDAISGTGRDNPPPRSTKRLRLSPTNDTPIMRRSRFARDHIGESRNLMQRIRAARIPIAWTTSPDESSLIIGEDDDDEIASPPESPTEIDTPPEGPESDNGKRPPHSSVALRQDADFLMARIKSDWAKERVLSAAVAFPAATAPLSPDSKSISNKHDADAIADKKHANLEPAPARQKISKATPRKLLRRLSAAEEIDRELAHESLSFHDNPLGGTQSSIAQSGRPASAAPVTIPTVVIASPPKQDSAARVPGMLHPTGSTRNLEDITRFVSSSTAASSGLSSMMSCVKHPGPPTVTRIAPADVPALPERVGGMIFDKASAKWVKADVTMTSDDPFQDIDSLRDSSSRNSQVKNEFNGQPPAQYDEPLENELTTERYDHSWIEPVSPRPRGYLSDDSDAVRVVVTTGHPDDMSDSEWELSNPPTATMTYPATAEYIRRASPFDAKSPMPPRAAQSSAAPGPTPPTSGMLPQAPGSLSGSGQLSSALANTMPFSNAFAQSTSQVTPPAPMALSSEPDHPISAIPPHMQIHSTPQPVSRQSTPPMPRSALKNGGASAAQTPMNQRARSVSFSDGRKDGKIRGLRSAESSTTTEQETVEQESTDDQSTLDQSNILPLDITAPSMSLRGKRIANMFNDLEDEPWDMDTPSKSSNTSDRIALLDGSGTLQPLPTSKAGTQSRDSSRGVKRSSAHRSSSSPRNLHQTFLTECSFGVAHDRLVQVITDVQPFEPYWEKLLEIDLNKRNVESVARLKEFLPKIEKLSLDGNRVEWLTGLPSTLRKLSARDNWITSLTAFTHLSSLQVLDLSKNQLASLQQLECLHALRELTLEGNEVESIAGLENLSALERLHLRGNKIRDLDLGICNWPSLESLDVSNNQLRVVQRLDILSDSLCSLNLDGNKLQTLGAPSLPKLRILRLSDNSLKTIELRGMPALRTLYADGNALRAGTIQSLGKLKKLENLSLRNQGGSQCAVVVGREIRDVKRLYLSANPLPTHFLQEACFSVVYLELAACRLESLPSDMAQLVPNVRVLNLNYNFLSDLSPLAGLSRMRKLTIIGSRLQSARNVLRVLRSMPDLEMTDFRMNPFSLGWYLPLLVRDVPGALQPTESGSRKVGLGSTWEELDRKFRGDLPDGSYIGRLAYRGLVMEACQGIEQIDGVGVKEEERAKAQQLLRGVAKSQGRPQITV